MKLDLSITFDLRKFEVYSTKLKDKGAKVELKEVRQKRTNLQNRYIHVCFGIYGDYSGYTIEEIKVILKRQFGRFMIYEKSGTQFLRSTADLDTLEMTQFVDWLRDFAMNDGCYIPDPDEYKADYFKYEKDLQHIL